MNKTNVAMTILEVIGHTNRPASQPFWGCPTGGSRDRSGLTVASGCSTPTVGGRDREIVLLSVSLAGAFVVILRSSLLNFCFALGSAFKQNTEYTEHTQIAGYIYTLLICRSIHIAL